MEKTRRLNMLIRQMDDLEGLLAEAGRFVRGPIGFHVAMLAVLSGMAALGIGCMSTILPDIPPAYSTLATALFVSLTAYAFVLSARGKRLLRRLAAFDDLRVVDPMLQIAYQYTSRKTRALMEESLTRLLPKMNTAAYYSLSHAARETLYEELFLQPPRLARATVETFQRCDDMEAIDAVEQLVDRCASHSEYQEVSAAAETCLRHLRRQVHKATEAKRLLRAVRDVPSESLLRAASGQRETDPATLLRVTVVQDDNTPAG
jgi:hypothetical protein